MGPENFQPLRDPEVTNGVEDVSAAIEYKHDPETKEGREAIRNDVLEKIRALHESRHADKEFHGTHHPEAVYEDANEIFDAIGETNPSALTDKERHVLDAATLGHDSVIEVEKVDDPSNAFAHGTNRRFRGFDRDKIPNVEGDGILHINVDDPEVVEEYGNEMCSAIETAQVWKLEDPLGKVYSFDDYEALFENIAATYPEVQPNPFVQIPKGAEIVNSKAGEEVDVSRYLQKDEDGNLTALQLRQPTLDDNKESSLGALATGFADLSRVGKVSSEEFTKSGNSEFLELNWLIKEELVSESVDELIPERKVAIVNKILGWVGAQAGFALWQKIRLNDNLETQESISNLPNAQAARDKIHEIYSEFDNNIIAAGERSEKMNEEYGGLRSADAFLSPEADKLFIALVSDTGFEVKDSVEVEALKEAA